jgi:hypothetical protein
MPRLAAMSDIDSFQPGDRVRAGLDGSFVGNLIKTGESARQTYVYVRTGADWNVPLWAVEDPATGEVRFFVGADAVKAEN